MALNSEVPAVDVRVIRVRDLDVDEVRQKTYTSSVTNLGTTVTQTLTAAAVMSGFMTYSGATTTHTLPTAALLVAYLPRAVVGERIEFYISNTGAGTVTLANPTGGTAGSSTLTIATLITKKVGIVLTNVTASSEAYTWYLS